MATRACSKCGEEKEFTSENFSMDAQKKSGLSPCCKLCKNAKQRERREAHQTKPRYYRSDTELECTKCREIKPRHLFHDNKANSWGKQAWCKACMAIRSGLETSEQRRAWRIKRLYKLGTEEYASLLASQDGKCACCGDALTDPVVDHCHSTGRVRGILCRECNIGIGLLGDSLESVESAARYLRISRREQKVVA